MTKTFTSESEEYRAERIKADRFSVMFLHHKALSSLHNGGVGAHEGHRILLDLVAKEHISPTDTHRITL